jgi:hypothetical protein
MVYSPLYLGGFIGVALSGAFVYWEIGKFATPQVPRTLFDERKEMFAYTAGLFVGIPIALPMIFFLSTMAAGFILLGLAAVGIIVAATEVAQWALLRTVYFGSDSAGPFYALGFRAGIGGILTLALVARFFSGPTITWAGLGLTLVQSVSLLMLQVAGALLSLRATKGSGRVGGRPLSGGAVTGVGLYFLGLGLFLGMVPGLVTAAIVALGMGGVYLRLRDPILQRVKPPEAERDDMPTTAEPAFGRTDR